MAVKTGSSHGFAVLFCTIVAALLVELLRPSLPSLIDPALDVAHWVVWSLALPIDPYALAIVLVASLLAFLWGVVYHVQRRSPW